MNGLRASNARPGGGYQAPVLPTSIRVGGDVIKPETWDEVLSYLQAALEENEKLNRVLKENNERIEKIVKMKDDEIETNQKLYWDVRISVLGLKSKIMSLTGEVEQLQKDAHSSEASSAAAKEIDELRRKIEELSSTKNTVEIGDSQLTEELESVTSRMQFLEGAYRKANEEYRSNTTSLQNKIMELEDQLKKNRSPPQPKPRTNVQTRQDGKMSQLEKERDELKLLVERHRQRADEEWSSRQQAEEKWISAKADLDKRQRELEMSSREIQNVQYQKSQLEGRLSNLQFKCDRLEKENTELRTARPNPVIGGGVVGGGGEISMAGGGGRAKQRRLLNEAIEERNVFERKNNQLVEDLRELELQLSEKSRRFEEASSENIHMRNSNRHHEQEVSQLKEQMDDIHHQLDRTTITYENKIKQLEDQLQNINEKYHFLQVEYSKAVSSLRNQKQKVSDETAGLASDFDYMQKEVDELLKNLDEKDSIIQKLTDNLWQAESLKDNADSERERLIAKMKEKQQHCDSYLEQMEAWRLQYETAQSDFTQERAVREKEALAVKTLRENRDELQREVGELRKRVTDQRITIANMQTSSGYVPESYTREINITTAGGGTGGTGGGGAGGMSPKSGRQHRYTGDVIGGGGGGYPQAQRYGDDITATAGVGGYQQPLQPHPQDMYRRDNVPYTKFPPLDELPKKDDFPPRQLPQDARRFDPPPMDPIYNIPEPHLGHLPERMNQLDNPLPPPAGGKQYRSSPANAFPQFQQGGGAGGGNQHQDLRGHVFDLPGEVQKMEAPIIDNCPICGRNGFKTQTDLEVHAAKCG